MDLSNINEYIPQIIATLIAIVALILFRYILKKVVRNFGETSNKAQGRIMRVQQIVRILINILFILSVAAIWGLKGDKIVPALLTMFTVLGVALFAQWSVLSNITAGIVMYFSAPYRLGDRIRIIDKDAPIVATVENILSFYTHLRTDGGELIVLPNNIFLQKIVAVLESDTE